VYVVQPSASALRPLHLPTVHGRALGPAWSPDGRSIAYTDYDIWIFDVATGRARRLTSGGGWDLPRWSPDGSRILAARELPPSGLDLFVIDVATKHVRRLFSQPGDRADGAWSPDGGSIAFVEDGDVYVAAADGSTSRRLGTGNDPSWFPDVPLLASTEYDGI